MGGLIIAAVIRTYNSYDVENSKIQNKAHKGELVLNYHNYLNNYQGTDNKTMLVDIRNKEIFDKNHIENAVNIPLNDLFMNEALKSLKKHKGNIVIYSESEDNSVIATLLLQSIGFSNIYALAGNHSIFKDNIINNYEKPYLFYNSEKMKWNYPNFFQDKTMDSDIHIPEPKNIRVQGGCI